MADPFAAALEQRSNPFEAAIESRRTVEPTDPPVPLVETAPLETPPIREAIPPVVPTLGAVATPPSGPDERTVKAAERGVLFDKPAPAGRVYASFAYDDTARARGIRMGLQKHYGHDTDVRVVDGDIEYYDPETNRYALVDPSGLDVGDIEDLAGPAVTMVPELGAGVITAAVTKNPWATNIAASAGAAVGESMRLWTGRKLGVNEGLTNSDIAAEAIKTAGIAAAGGVAADKMLQFMRYSLDFLDGKRIPKWVAESLEIDKAMRVRDEINNTLGEELLEFNLAQATGDDFLLNAQEQFKRGLKYGPQFWEFADKQNAALQQFHKIISKPYRSPLEGREPVGEAAREVARTHISLMERRFKQPVIEMGDRLSSTVQALPATPLEAAGKPVRKAAGAAYEAFRQEADIASTAMKEAAGTNKFIQNTKLSTAVKDLSREQKTLLFPFQRGRYKLGEQFEGATASPQEAAWEALVSEDEGRKLSKAFDPKSKLSFEEAWNNISVLKRLIRESQEGLSTDAPDVGMLKKLVGAMEQDLDAGMADSPLASSWSEYKNWYKGEKDRLDRSVIGEVMHQQGGTWKFRDREVFDRMLPPAGSEEAREVFAVVGDDLKAMEAIRGGFYDKYVRDVIDPETGRPNLGRHNTFMSQYEDVMKPFFTSAERRHLKSVGGLERALKAREVREAGLLRELRDTFEGEIASISQADKVFMQVWRPNEPSRMGKLFRMLDRHKVPGVKRAVRAQAVREIKEKVTDPKTGVFSARRLDTFMNGAADERGFGHRNLLKETFGERYVTDLDQLLTALKIAQREARNPNYSMSGHVAEGFKTKIIKDMARAYVGLFTRAGRMITAGARIRGRQAERALARAILNPTDLHALVSLRETSLGQRRAVTLLGNLGATAWLQSE